MRRGNYGNNVGSDCIQCIGYHDTLPKFLQYFSMRKTMQNPTLDESHIELIQRAHAIRLSWRERESRLKQKSSPQKKIQPNAVKKFSVKAEDQLITYCENPSEKKLRSIEEKLEEAKVKCRNVETKLECLRQECSNYISKVIDTF